MDYAALVDDKRLDAFIRLIDVIDANLPVGFEKTTDGTGIHYVVPLSTYPAGYHVSPGTPLPFLSVIAQKNHVALYHMGVYSDPELLRWFEEAYAAQVPTKLNMGKSCFRFGNVKHIPYALIGELVSKMTPEERVAIYHGSHNPSTRG